MHENIVNHKSHKKQERCLQNVIFKWEMQEILKAQYQLQSDN